MQKRRKIKIGTDSLSNKNQAKFMNFLYSHKDQNVVDMIGVWNKFAKSPSEWVSHKIELI